MKILKSNEWTKPKYIEQLDLFMSSSKKFEEVILFKKAKYVDVVRNIVIFCSILAPQRMSLSNYSKFENNMPDSYVESQLLHENSDDSEAKLVVDLT